MKKSVHVLIYKGFRFETWWHKAPGRQKPVRAIYLMTDCASGVFTKKMGLKYWMDKLILDHKKDQARKARSEFLKSLSNEELVKHPNFAYARLKTSMSGNYYSIYWKTRKVQPVLTWLAVVLSGSGKQSAESTELPINTYHQRKKYDGNEIKRSR
jgi:hypothetical protein